MTAHTAAVCFDPVVAAAVLAGGVPVVLCGSDGRALSQVLVDLRPAGRVALIVGDPDDDAVVAAAVAMAAELFGPEAVVVRSATEVAALGARPPIRPGIG